MLENYLGKISTSDFDVDGKAVNSIADAVSGQNSVPGFVDMTDPNNRLFTTITINHP